MCCGTVECRLCIACFATERQTLLGMAHGSIWPSGLGVCSSQQTLRTQMVQKISNFQPMKAGSMSRMNHSLNLIISAMIRLHQIPCNIV